jgi:hypothetical protein
MSPAIDQDSAGISVDGAQQSTQTVEEADDENGGANFLEVLWKKAHPEFFAGADTEDGNEEDHQIAPQPEKFRDLTL